MSVDNNCYTIIYHLIACIIFFAYHTDIMPRIYVSFGKDT